jgi:hypothetical protein
MPNTPETLVPVTIEGKTQFLPLAEPETPTYLIFVNADKVNLLTTSDPNGDRVAVGGVTLAEAVGKVLMENPMLRYEDIADHMEV